MEGAKTGEEGKNEKKLIFPHFGHFLNFVTMIWLLLVLGIPTLLLHWSPSFILEHCSSRTSPSLIVPMGMLISTYVLGSSPGSMRSNQGKVWMA